MLDSDPNERPRLFRAFPITHPNGTVLLRAIGLPLWSALASRMYLGSLGIQV
jgi:hypothetical protein